MTFLCVGTLAPGQEKYLEPLKAETLRLQVFSSRQHKFAVVVLKKEAFHATSYPTPVFLTELFCVFTCSIC